MPFEEARRELESECGPEIQAAIVYLMDNKHPIKAINKKHASWWIKHDVEHWYEEKYGHHLYIAEGSVVAAAVMMGYKFRRSKVLKGAYFNMEDKKK